MNEFGSAFPRELRHRWATTAIAWWLRVIRNTKCQRTVQSWKREAAMWILIGFGLFAFVVGVVSLTQGASRIERLELSDARNITHQERRAA